MHSIGIHHVAVAHQNSVKPRTNGKNWSTTGECGDAAMSVVNKACPDRFVRPAGELDLERLTKVRFEVGVPWVPLGSPRASRSFSYFC